jgi:hypothetical protein
LTEAEYEKIKDSAKLMSSSVSFQWNQLQKYNIFLFNKECSNINGCIKYNL